MSDYRQHVDRKTGSGNVVLGVVLGAVGAAAALSIGIAILDPTGFFGFLVAVPGRFLYASFHAAAWWVPLYLMILAVISARSAPMTWPTVILINLGHIPVLTIAAILRLLTLEGAADAPVLAWLINAFTLRGSMLVLSLVLALEAVGILQVWRFLESLVDERPADQEPVDSPPALLSAPVTGFSDSKQNAEAEEMVEADELDETVEPIVLEEPVIPEEPIVPENPELSETGLPSAEELRRTLAALRKKMEEGLEEEGLEPESDLPAEVTEESDPEAPLPLYFRREEEEYEEEDYEEVEEYDEEELSDNYTEWSRSESEPPAVKPGRRYELPIEGILRQYSDGRYWEIDGETRDAGEVLRITLEEFGIKAEVTGIRKGPVITMFEILPAPGVKLAKITNLADNIALRLAASSVRIVAPIPGKHAVGIEIPNKERNIVSFGELLRDDEFFGDQYKLPIALGKDISGEAQIVDLARTPHLLIAGATGSGKSVCVNSIICSILYRQTPSKVKLVLIDPKIVELKFYNDIPHLLTPVITDPKRAFQALQYLIYEMERRYSLLDSLGARDISGFNGKIKRKNLATEPMPYIVVIIDEFADLMATSGKELESTVARLAAMSRAVGIHIVLATQRPSTDVITGLIKANIPSRIAFMVASKVDSRIIIDMVGAEKLLGRGDMLFTSSENPFPVRIQGAFLSEDEVERVVEEVKTFGEPEYIDDEIFIDDDEDDIDADVLEDPLMEKAIEVVTTSRKGSASYLQRRLKVGYNRAARMVEEMERMGIVGPQNGSKPRDVIGSV